MNDDLKLLMARLAQNMDRLSDVVNAMTNQGTREARVISEIRADLKEIQAGLPSIPERPAA